MMDHANIRREWDYYQGTVKHIRLGYTAALKSAKDKLGYSLSELVPFLLHDVDALCANLSTANGDLIASREMLQASDKKLKTAEKMLQDTDKKLKTTENKLEQLTQDHKNGVRR